MSEKNEEIAHGIVYMHHGNSKIKDLPCLENDVKQALDQKDRDHEALIGVLVGALENLIKAQDERLQLKYSATGRPEIGSWLWDEARTALSHPLVQEYLKKEKP